MSLQRQWFTLFSLVMFSVVFPAVAPAAGPEEAGRECEDPHRFEIEFEGGAAWQSRNDVEIPNDGTATRFSLHDLVGNGPLAGGKDLLYLEHQRATWRPCSAGTAELHRDRNLLRPGHLRR